MDRTREAVAARRARFEAAVAAILVDRDRLAPRVLRAKLRRRFESMWHEYGREYGSRKYARRRWNAEIRRAIGCRQIEMPDGRQLSLFVE